MSRLSPTCMALAFCGALACGSRAGEPSPTESARGSSGSGGEASEEIQVQIDAPEDSSMVLIDRNGRIGFETNVRMELATLPGTSGRAARALGQTLQGRMSEIRGCYDRAVANDPEVEGSLEIVLSTDPRGRPSTEVARAGFTGGRITECVTTLLRRLPRAGLPSDARIQVVLVASNTIAAGSREVREHREQQEQQEQQQEPAPETPGPRAP
jgi:hypothetical protein